MYWSAWGDGPPPEDKFLTGTSRHGCHTSLNQHGILKKSQLFIAVSPVKEPGQTSLALSLFIMLRETASRLDVTFIAHDGIMKGRFSVCRWRNWCGSCPSSLIQVPLKIKQLNNRSVDCTYFIN